MTRTGRRSKYSEELSRTICEAISLDGIDESGWKAGEITKSTFYKWMSDFPDFLDAVERARVAFRRTCSPRLRSLGLQRLTDALETGHTITWETSSTQTVERRNATGEIIFTDTISKNSQHTERRGTPSWAIDRVIPKAMNLEECIKAVQAAGYIVIDPTVKPKEAQQQGLTEEGADLIKARILFGESHPELEMENV